MPQVDIFGPIDVLFGAEIGIADILVIEVLLLGLVVANFVTRKLAHDQHVEQANKELEDDEEPGDAVSRFVPHEVINVALLVASFYYMTVEYHAGFIVSALVVGLFLTDFFEFEARKVEARREIPLERPKGSLAAAMLVLVYVAYQTLFFLIEGPFGAVV